MSKSHSDKDSSEIRVELKYCEHCGGLWVRERGAGVVYCEKCQAKVEDLPIAKKKPRRAKLPMGPRTVVDQYETGRDEESRELKAVGGAMWAR